MYASSPTFQYPSTPAGSRNPLQFRPLNSSPLAGSSPGSPKTSPVTAAQARRKSQYKGHSPITPLSFRSVSSGQTSSRRSDSSQARPVEGDSQKALLRGRFKARCVERAVRAREKAILGRRSSRISGDDFYMDDDEEEGDDEIMKDEIFRRIVANANRKQTHMYRLSYAQEVGSSFDPDIEDVRSWEQELAVSDPVDSPGTSIPLPAVHSPSTLAWLQEPQVEDLKPADLDDEEIEAYAEECARRAALAEFEDIPVEELFNWSPDELDDAPQPSVHHGGMDMDMS